MKENLNYREWQARNTRLFRSLDKVKQNRAREQGYYNVGWEKVKASWKILQSLSDKVVNLFDAKLDRGDLVGAIELSILELERGKTIAKNTLEELDKTQQDAEQLAKRALAKYDLL
ncbi:hypothetical protein V0288_00965 [Pannus brasiliensis CCIBt3594]|uniref:Uncharacterized protein n=1 Tax=Pannus brasiliensis CCIBt3594 TaxID=1427578 RepID=A0AAW9QQ15_9CHRO